MVRSHSFAWILVSLLLLVISIPLQADIAPSGDVIPTDHSWWTGGGDSLINAYIGKTGAGSVTVNLGSDLNSKYGYIGLNSGSTGEVTVDGSGSTWTNSDHLYIGYEGHGTLNITNGGAVSNYYCQVGYNLGSTGVVTVDGGGSTWTNTNDLSVGLRGQGTLNITDSGDVSNHYGYIGYNSGVIGEVTVDGSDSTWTNSGNLYVGYYGHGTLNITNGGVVSNPWGSYIGWYSSGSNVVTVDGSGSIWICSGDYGTLDVGSCGQGTLNITNNGAVSNTSGYIGRYSGSAGVVTVDGSGSTWTNSGDLYVGGGSSSSGGTGELTVSNSGSVEVGGTLKIWSTGTVQGNGTITANVVINAGAVKPGISAGILSVNGDYTQEAGGLLEIEISGLSAGTDHDQVAITGTANLAGTLDLSLIGEYVPDFYDEFEILTASGLNGTFDTIAGYSVNSGMSLAVVYDADSVTVVATIPGDATLDTNVTGADYTVYALNYGTGSSWEEGDFNGDGAVTGADYTIYALNYGGGPIPEPTSMLLLALGGLTMLKRRSQRTV